MKLFREFKCTNKEISSAFAKKDREFLIRECLKNINTKFNAKYKTFYIKGEIKEDGIYFYIEDIKTKQKVNPEESPDTEMWMKDWETIDCDIMYDALNNLTDKIK